MWRRPGIRGPVEVTRRMFESDARRPLADQPVAPTASGFEDEEPPSQPARHPLWKDVPDHQWDDWRWQTQNAIRSVRQLRNLLPLHARRAGSHRPAGGRVQARHPAVLLLAHRPGRPGRPDPAPVGALAAGSREPVRVRAGRPARRGQGLAGPRPDAPLPRPRAARHDARLHDVLPVLHPQARHDDPRRLGRRQPPTTSG